MEDCGVLVFARAPVPGATKTRLIPALGPAGAARLHERLVRHVLAEAIAADVGTVELCCTPDTQHPFFADCAQRLSVRLSVQVGADLGERMLNALARRLESARCALLVGSDIPSLTAGHLQRARQSLNDADAVFIPAEDGGYVLVGVWQPHSELFSGIAWGEEAVMAETRKRAAAAGLRIAVLDPLWDLDRPADLARVEPALLAGLDRP